MKRKAQTATFNRVRGWQCEPQPPDVQYEAGCDSVSYVTTEGSHWMPSAFIFKPVGRWKVRLAWSHPVGRSNATVQILWSSHMPAKFRKTAQALGNRQANDFWRDGPGGRREFIGHCLYCALLFSSPPPRWVTAPVEDRGGLRWAREFQNLKEEAERIWAGQ